MVSLLDSTEAEFRARRQRKLRRLAFVLIAVVAVGGLVFTFLGDEVVAPVVQAARDRFTEHRALEQRDVLLAAARESGVDVNLLAGLMISESSGKPDAVSSMGALGLFQLMPKTARWRAEKMGLPAPLDEELLTNPGLNARLGASNLAWLLSIYDGNVERALVAYNAGPGRLKSFETAAGGWEAWRKERREAGNSEIFAYVDRVLRYAAGFAEHALFEPSEETDAVAQPHESRDRRE